MPNRGRRTIYFWLGFIAVVRAITIGGIAASIAIEGQLAVNNLLAMMRNPAM